MGAPKIVIDCDHVVLVADLIDEADSVHPIQARRDLEMTDRETLETLIGAIGELGLPVQHYESPADLARHAAAHRNAVVLPIYGGQRSRNRMALVPAVCETFGLRFVGPDVYGRIVAQDKEIAKRLALDCGLLTPPWRVLRSGAPLRASAFAGLELPVVVKPLMEGSSIGISGRNLCHSIDAAETLAGELMIEFDQPILIEHFLGGREVAFTKIASQQRDVWAFSEIAMRGDPGYFDTRLFDAEEKTLRKPGRFVRNIDNELADYDKCALEYFLTAYGRYGYCRIDGRLVDGKFHFLELTPDAWIAPLGQFAASLIEKGWTYPQIIAAVLASVDSDSQDRSASG